MKENQLVSLSRTFAINIVLLCNEMRENKKSSVLINQLVRSGTSIGANIHEANYAVSKADFINKFQIALKECYETEYWLDIFNATGFIDSEKFADMTSQSSKIRRLLTASLNTAKQNISEE
ncbi:MAG: four helix bundle protein [Clostridia bacterium]|nr:four helix bundle protein [Clostridia bacterium]